MNETISYILCIDFQGMCLLKCYEAFLFFSFQFADMACFTTYYMYCCEYCVLCDIIPSPLGVRLHLGALQVPVEGTEKCSQHFI